MIKKIAEEVKRGWPELDAVIGGQISIDIYPKGYDKSQVLEHIEKRHPEGNDKSQILKHIEADEYIFIGDRTETGGNDYPLAKLMEATENWKHTIQILEKLSD